MSARRSLREKTPVSYAESDGTTSPFATPGSARKSIVLTDSDEDDDDEDELALVAERHSSAGHSLRPRSALNLSMKANENGDKKRKTQRRNGIIFEKKPRKRSNKSTPRNTSHSGGFDLTPPMTSRNLVRAQIANITAAKRDQFFIAKKDYFLPLLPENNYITKTISRLDSLNAEEKEKLPEVVDYEELTTQPKGITAIMKPYQLSGLSFMVHLHRNGLSGILGDEMGLGKTLQTISLIQYLKETEPTPPGDQIRPFLVICPLSVLSSWMAETQKWAPGLKVLRFHGPMKERDRLKKIAAGEIDIYGNMTTKAKRKANVRRTASGHQVISLDSDSEDEEVARGVDVVVTTYESYLAEQGWFKRAFVWRYVVLDEGHKIKNDKSLVSGALQGLQAEYRLILTGTPLQNNLGELWALFHWLYQDVFTEQTRDLFENSFDLTRGFFENEVLDNSRRLLELMMLRRMKNSPGVDLNLPQKTEVLLFVPLTPLQRFWYTRLITRADQGLLEELFKGAKDKEEQDLKNEEDAEATLIKKDAEALAAFDQDLVEGSNEWKESREILKRTIEREKIASGVDAIKKSSWQKLMNLLMQLRKVCNHPYQISHAEPDPYEIGDHVILASGKFIVLEKLVNELVVQKRKKILIFSGFTKMLDLVDELLALVGAGGDTFRSVRLDGKTGRARRNLSIRMFNDLNSNVRVMLISTRAGGLGVNLASASDVILLDQDWNPQITLQAEARAHRIGQKNPVTIYKFVSQGTVEEQMMGRIQKKLYLSAKVTESMQNVNHKSPKKKIGRAADAESVPQMSTGELMALVRRGASAMSKADIDVTDILAWDWQTTLEKCKDQPTDITVKKDAIPDATVDSDAEKKWLSEMEKVESCVFEGKKLERSNGKRETTFGDIAQEWNRADRRVGKNTTVMVDGFAINKESMNCGDWEAVPTLAGKDPRLAEPKREKRAPIQSQSHCQVCMDGGDIYCCAQCPRAYHYKCLDTEFKAKTKSITFVCPQHQCHDCSQKTGDAGGMLYRCRWCERAYCEDCQDFDKAILIGENLPEYELLKQSEIPQAFYVQCSNCTDHFEQDQNGKAFCEAMAEDIDAEHKKMFGDREASMTDATTIETTGANTPLEEEDVNDLSRIEAGAPVPVKKRKTSGVHGKVAKRTKI